MPKAKEAGQTKLGAALDADAKHAETKAAKPTAKAKAAKPQSNKPVTGKSSNKDYQQVSMWLKKTTVKKAKYQALDTDTDFSDIVQEALDKHLPK